MTATSTPIGDRQKGTRSTKLTHETPHGKKSNDARWATLLGRRLGSSSCRPVVMHYGL
jgi:hypothetical protein